MWELTSVRVPGGDSLVGAAVRVLSSSAFPATEHLCCGFQLRLCQAPVSAGHEHALFLSKLLHCHLWCLQRAGCQWVLLGELQAPGGVYKSAGR